MRQKWEEPSKGKKGVKSPTKFYSVRWVRRKPRESNDSEIKKGKEPKFIEWLL